MSGHGFWRGALGGLVAGLAAAAVMEVGGAVVGVQTLPQLVQEPLLAVMPGAVFGFLIDTLQHWGKVIEEAGLIVLMITLLTLLGAAVMALVARRPGLRGGLLAGAAAWLVVALVVLPLGGAGLFGLAGGFQVPVVWGLVFAVYALVWEWVVGRAQAPPVDLERRRVAIAVPVLVGLGSLAVIGGLRVPEWLRSALAPPESRLAGPVPEITPVADFYQISKNFQDPAVPAQGWSLRVHGMVDRPLRLSLADLESLPSVTEAVTLECISNDVGGPLMSTGRFTGVPLRDLLAMAGPSAGTGALAFKSRDGYTESLAIQDAIGSTDILIATRLDGAPLPDAHGFPARVLIPGHYGMKGPKWLDEIQAVSSAGGGYWEGQGWDPAAAIRTTARFDTPTDFAQFRVGPVTIGGVAFGGARGIHSVEWSADNGRSWSPADVRPALSQFTWVLWHATWTPAREGVYDLIVRARDGEGAVQSSERLPSFPSGASGYHKIAVQVGR